MYGYGYKYVNGLVVSGGAPTPPPFVNTKSLLFDGVDSNVNVPALGITGSAARTMTGWFKTSSSANQNIMGFGVTTSTKYFTLALYNSGGFRIFGHTWTGGDVLGPVVSLNEWHFAALIYNGTQISISLDGSAFVTKARIINTTDTAFRIGQSGYASWNNFTGNIDEVAIFNSALSQTDINDMYNGGTPTDLSLLATPPLHWYRNGDNDTYPTITDVGSAASNNGTMTNMDAGDIVPDVP